MHVLLMWIWHFQKRHEKKLEATVVASPTNLRLWMWLLLAALVLRVVLG